MYDTYAEQSHYENLIHRIARHVIKTRRDIRKVLPQTCLKQASEADVADDLNRNAKHIHLFYL